MAEFTADRAGLLACQNIDVATESLMKLAGYPRQYYNSINKEEFIKQFDDFKDYNDNMYNKALNLFANLEMDHPWSVLRGKELYEWVNNGSYENILNRSNKKITEKSVLFCHNCGKERTDGKFCPFCGNPYI
jgi:rubrerythrin